MTRSEYDSSAIRPLRPPDVDGCQGRWRSKWLLDVSRDVSVAACDAALSDGFPPETRMRRTPSGRIELALITEFHPMLPDSFASVDQALRRVDTEFGLIAINDSPKHFWRTFRG